MDGGLPPNSCALVIVAVAVIRINKSKSLQFRAEANIGVKVINLTEPEYRDQEFLKKTQNIISCFRQTEN